MNLKTTLIAFFITISFSGFSQVWKTYPYTPATTPTSEITFPLDEGRHNGESVEWWYMSGHITTASNKKYSFMLTYFYYPTSISIFNFDGFRILNLTDESDGTFYQDTKPLNYTMLSQTDLDIVASLKPSGSEYWRNKVDIGNVAIPFEYELSAASSNVSITFDLTSIKRPLIVGDDGKFDQGLSSYTYYYSQTGNTVTGSLTVDGVTETVTGNAWIDRQYGTFNPFTGEDYEWFNIKLDNGTDLNLWNVFNSNREVPNNLKYKILSAYVDENQNTQYTTSDFEIERLEYFITPDNLKSYSKKWRLTSTSKNIDLIITSNYEVTEVNIPELSFRFYEGPTTISGTMNGVSVSGIGFAELLHNYENPDVSISSPSEGVYNSSTPISWVINNPDDGRPLKYDLEYSIDNKVTFLPITSGLTTTSYSWDGSGVSNGNAIWFKVKAYSLDNTFKGEVISTSSSSVTLELDELKKAMFDSYPNPVENTLSLKLKQVLDTGSIEIIDFSGKLIFEQPLSSTLIQQVDVTQLVRGIYFVRLKERENIQTVKFIKK